MESNRAIVIAAIANVVVVSAKFVAAGATGSSAMILVLAADDV